MVQTSAMPKSIHSSISVDAVGEALLKHYNVGITNPWFEAGYSDQETYNRRKLPWAGKSYNIVNGEVAGDASEVPENLKQQWANFAEEVQGTLEGETFDNMDDHYEALSSLSPDRAVN